MEGVNPGAGSWLAVGASYLQPVTRSVAVVTLDAANRPQILRECEVKGATYAFQPQQWGCDTLSDWRALASVSISGSSLGAQANAGASARVNFQTEARFEAPGNLAYDRVVCSSGEQEIVKGYIDWWTWGDYQVWTTQQAGGKVNLGPVNAGAGATEQFWKGGKTPLVVHWKRFLMPSTECSNGYVRSATGGNCVLDPSTFTYTLHADIQSPNCSDGFGFGGNCELTAVFFVGGRVRDRADGMQGQNSVVHDVAGTFTKQDLQSSLRVDVIERDVVQSNSLGDCQLSVPREVVETAATTGEVTWTKSCEEWKGKFTIRKVL